MFQQIQNNYLEFKRKYIRNYKPQNIIAEIIPYEFSNFFPIDSKILTKLHQFVSNNPIYFKKTDIEINNLKFIAYEGDVNEYYLSSKKYDTNYQPFYPTWMLSALLLCLHIKKLGFTELIDIGSGDGRIPYCGSLLNLRSIGIELDSSLTELQTILCKLTEINFEIINGDAAVYNFTNLNLFKPIFFISGLPEMGEMFVENVIKISIQNNLEFFGIIFLESTIRRKFASNVYSKGWEQIIKKNNFKKIEEIDLPTHWTNDNNTETKYLITISKSEKP